MSIEERIKKLTSKQKVYIVATAFLFVIQFPMRISYPIYSIEFLGDYRYLLIFLISGIFVALKRRNNSRIIEKNKSLTNILSNDYILSSYASLSSLGHIPSSTRIFTNNPLFKDTSPFTIKSLFKLTSPCEMSLP